MNVHTKPNPNIEIPLGLRNLCHYKIKFLVSVFFEF